MKRMLDRPWIVVLVLAVITVFFAAWLPRIVLDNNTFRFVPESSRTRQELAAVDELFGNQTPILIGLHRRSGTILEREYLLKLRDLSRRAAEFPLVSEVTSLVSAQTIRGEGDAIVAESLVPEGFEGTEAEIRALRDKVLEWDVYRRALISDDFTSTQILVALEVNSDEAGSGDTVRLYQDLKDLAASLEFPDTEIYLTGLPAFASVMNTAMRSDLVVLIPLVAIVILLVLFLSFRRAGGIILPMLTVLIAVIWSVGAMAMVGVKLSLIATVLPVILVAVGSAYGIHVISHYYDDVAAHRGLDRAAHRDIVLESLRKVSRPVFLAALTTLAGFVSLCFTSVVPIREFGVFASLGVVVAFVVAVTLVPALLVLQGPPRKTVAASAPVDDDAHLERDGVSRAVANGLTALNRRPVLTLVVTVLLLVAGIGASRLVVFDNVIVEYFKPDTDIARSDVFIRQQFGGSKSLSVVVKSEVRGGVLDPAVLSAMDELDGYLNAKVPEVGKVTGYHQLIKRMNQIFNVDEPAEGRRVSAVSDPSAGGGTSVFGFDGGFGFGDTEETEDTATPAAMIAPAATVSPVLDELGMVALLERALAAVDDNEPTVDELMRELYRQINYRGAAYYEIPTDPARYGKTTTEELKTLIGNYLILLSGDSGEWADDPLEPRVVRMNIQLTTVGQRDTRRVVEAIRVFVADRFPESVTVQVVGSALVEGELNDMVVRSQISSLALSLLMVFLILWASYRSVAAGLIGIVPLGLSILLNFAVMGITGITLNIGTALVASVGVGVGIDYMVHYLAAYHRECLRGTPPARFLRRTFLTSGKAIIFNAVSVGAGFAVLTLSQFNMLAYLGGLIAIAMATSSLASLTILPALLTLLNPKFLRLPLPYERKTT